MDSMKEKYKFNWYGLMNEYEQVPQGFWLSNNHWIHQIDFEILKMKNKNEYKILS
jgi:hypothetical protein